MRKRVFGSIFLTSLVTLLLTTGLLLAGSSRRSDQ